MTLTEKYLQISELIKENPDLNVMTLVDVHSLSDDYDLPEVRCISVRKDFVYQPDGEYIYFESVDLEDQIYGELEENGDCSDKAIESRIKELKESGDIKEYIVVTIGN